MPTVVCHHCSEIFTVDGPKPDQCPSCGRTLHIEGDPTPTGPALHSTILQFGERKPTAFGRYVVQSRLGAGGFGSVFLAKDPQLDRLVAIKVPRGETGRSPLGLERFAREGRNIAQLRHPGIVSVFNVELDGELPFIVCEYVAGETLSDHMRKAPLSFRDAARLIADVATAVDYAHESGIIHRDIKPSNIMIDSDGKPRLMDFGLAKREAIDDPVTSPHAILGTPAYMSPEQAWGGKRGAVDRRSDIYALGTVLYQLLTRELPFRGEPRMVLRQVIEDDPKNPRSLNADIPRDLETICEKAMQKELAGRYQTAGALADDLNRWLRGEPIEARPVTRLERSVRWCRRNPAPAGLIAGAIMFLVAVSGGLWGYAAVQTTARQKSEDSRKELQEAFEKHQELLARAYVERGSRHLRAPQFSDDYNPIKALPWLSEAMKVDAKNPERLLADQVRLQLQLDLGPRIERMWFFKGEVRSAGLSPRRDAFYVAGVNGGFDVWRTAKSGPPVLSLPHPSAVEAAAFSPDGKLLATGSKDGVRIWETESGKLLKGPLVPQTNAPAKRAISSQITVNCLVFGKSGRRLLMASLERINQIWDVTTGEPIGVPITTRYAALSAAFAESERLVVLYDYDGHVRVHDVATGTEKYVLHGSGENYRTATVSPSGRQIAVCSDTGSLILLQAVSGEVIERMRVPDSRETCTIAEFSPNGELLATGSTDGIVRVWQANDHRLLWSKQISSGQNQLLQFSPDGTTLAIVSLGNRFSTVDARTGEMIAQSFSNFFKVKLAAWADPRQRVLSVDSEGVTRLWDLSSRVASVTLPNFQNIQSAVVSSNRRLLAVAGDQSRIGLLRLSADGRLDLDDFKTIQLDFAIRTIALSDDGSRLAVSGNREVSIWDTLSQKRAAGPMLHSEAVKLMRFSPNGARLVCLSQDGRAAVWETATGHRLYNPVEVSRHCVDIDIDADGSRCAVAAMNGVTIWELESGSRVGAGFLGDRFPSFVRFVNEPQRLIIGWRQKSTLLCDIPTGKARYTVPRRFDLQCLNASADKRLFLTAYLDGTARLWHANNAAPASPVFEYASRISSAFVDPNNRWVATLTEDSKILLWDARSAELVCLLPMPYLRPELEFLNLQTTLKPSIRLAFFSADARRLYLMSSWGPLISVRLEPDLNRSTQVASDSILRAGAEVDEAGGIRLLSLDELATRWRTFEPESNSESRASNANQTAKFTVMRSFNE